MSMEIKEITHVIKKSFNVEFFHNDFIENEINFKLKIMNRQMQMCVEIDDELQTSKTFCTRMSHIDFGQPEYNYGEICEFILILQELNRIEAKNLFYQNRGHYDFWLDVGYLNSKDNIYILY